MRRGLLSVMAIIVVTLIAGCDDSATTASTSKDKQSAADYKSRQQEIEREKKIVETAPWFGKTGLGDSIERNLPRYVRHELGQVIFDSDSVKAADMEYLGKFTEGNKTVRYWKIRKGMGDVQYAFVSVLQQGGVLMGIGYKKPAGVTD
jgi:hypothetical protein